MNFGLGWPLIYKPSTASALPHSQPIKGGLRGYTLTCNSQHLLTNILNTNMRHLVADLTFISRACGMRLHWRKQLFSVSGSQDKHALWLDTVNCSTRRRPVKSGLWLEVFLQRWNLTRNYFLKKIILKTISYARHLSGLVIIQLCAPDSTSISLPHPHTSSRLSQPHLMTVCPTSDTKCTLIFSPDGSVH